MSNKNLSAIIIALAMAVWLFSGELSSNIVTADDTLTLAKNSEIEHVRARKSQAEVRSIVLAVSGQTQANRVVQVKAEISGRVVKIPAIKGSHVKTDELLCKIAIDSRLSDFNQARARYKSAKLEYDGVLDLKRSGLQSKVNVAKAEAALESSRAATKRAELALEKTNIIAPFDGVVESQPVEVGDYLKAGEICVTLIEIDPILVVGQVAEKSISYVKQNDVVEVKLITGERLQGKVSFIGRSPNSTTRTYLVEVTIDQPGENIRAGLTAEMMVPIGNQHAHLISSASLVLDDKGAMGVRIVDANNIVRFKTVNILSEDAGGIWVDGLPEKINLIIVGHEEVFEGQSVKVDFKPLGTFTGS